MTFFPNLITLLFYFQNAVRCKGKSKHDDSEYTALLPFSKQVSAFLFS